MEAIQAGKSVYNEKPLAISLVNGKKLVDAANKKRVLLGCAPDTFMGGGIQTCRKLIDDDLIGEPVAATAFMVCHGHESWHPDPEFYYKVGGGPMLDMGPYYLTTLVNLNGAVGTIVTSFDVWGAHLPRIEIYGSEGTLSVPDPNTFGGPVKMLRAGSEEWELVPLSHGYAENSRGLGVADMACALRSCRAHRANGDLAYHVLETMHAFHTASEAGRAVELTSSCSRPASLPLGLIEGRLDR